MSPGAGWRTLSIWCMLSLAGCCALPALAQERLAGTPWAATASVERGRALLGNRQDSGCILCHTVPGMAAGGDIGPPLAGLAYVNLNQQAPFWLGIALMLGVAVLVAGGLPGQRPSIHGPGR